MLEDFRVLDTLSRAPCGSRGLDDLIARALGWQCSTTVAPPARHWSRPGEDDAWWRQSDSVPPAYSTQMEALLRELPPQTPVTIMLDAGPPRVLVGDGADLTVATARTPALALAWAVIFRQLAGGVRG